VPRLIALTILVCLASSPAYAYLDPGTGSILVQGFLAALAVISAGITAFWSRIRHLLPWRQSPKPSADPSDQDASRS